MPTFAYRAADRQGQTIDGVMEAPDARGVVERLQRDSYFPIHVKAQEEGRSAFGLTLPSLGRGRITRVEVLTLFQQLATLIEAGLPLDRALVILEELAPSPRLRVIVSDLLKSIRGGSSLAEAMAKHQPRPFSRLAVNMVRAGEKGGVLEPTLKRLAELLEETQAFKETLVSALIYPIMLTLAGTAAVVFLLTFVIPRFVEIFRDLGQSLPLVTQILLSLSTGLQQYWWLLALGILAIVFAVRVWLSTEGGRDQWDRIVLRLPLVGDVDLEKRDGAIHARARHAPQERRPRPDGPRRRPRARGQPGARAGHRARERGRSAGRRDRGSHPGGPDLPGHGRAHGPRRRRDGPAGRHAAQGGERF